MVSKPTVFSNGIGVGSPIPDGGSATIISGSGAPTNAVTGAGTTGVGSEYIDVVSGFHYYNTGTQASPTWALVGITGGTDTFNILTVTTSVAIGGAIIGADALGVTGTSTFTGSLTVASGDLILSSTGLVNWTDAFIRRAGAANVQFGGAASATPTAQTLSFQNGVGSNIAGVNATIVAPLGTGNATNGDLIIQTGVKVGSGSGAPTKTTALTLKGETLAAVFAGAVTVPGAAVAALTSTTTFTSGAAASVGTLTNAPAAGNPTSWIKIVDNGVTRYIPAW